MDGLIYLLVAFAAVWGLVFAYLFTMVGTQKRLQKDLDSLRSTLAERDRIALEH